MKQRQQARVVAFVIGALSLLSTGCLEDRSFHENDVFRFVEPLEGDFASAPLLVRWEGRPAKTAKWALFLDRAPIKPETSIEDLEVQERQNLWITEEQELTIDFVPPRSTSVDSRRDRHLFVVIPLDADGERIGEHAASVELTVVQG